MERNEIKRAMLGMMYGSAAPSMLSKVLDMPYADTSSNVKRVVDGINAVPEEQLPLEIAKAEKGVLKDMLVARFEHGTEAVVPTDAYSVAAVLMGSFFAQR